MVTIKGYQQRKTAEGKVFLVLELEGSLQIQPSQATGKLYASVSKCTMPCTFDEMTASELIGSTLPGRIIRESCEPYEFENPTTGLTVTLNYRFTYEPPKGPQNDSKLGLSKHQEVEVH